MAMIISLWIYTPSRLDQSTVKKLSIKKTLSCTGSVGRRVKKIHPSEPAIIIFLLWPAQCVFFYFPITFTPPPNDPHGITKEHLVAALRGVFSASPAMAEHVLPLLLEKLASSVPAAKLDALGLS